jgi:hypothetical protein
MESLKQQIKYKAFIPRDNITVDVLEIKYQNRKPVSFSYWHPIYGAAQNSIDDIHGILIPIK